MIHPTAVVDPKAMIHDQVRIGPYSVIGPYVEIHKNTEIQNHVTVQGPTEIGPDCRVFPYAAIGLEPQDKKFDGRVSKLVIGKENTLREYVTINRGTVQDRGVTTIGDRCWIMAYCHIAHDCQLGDDVIFANGTTLAGHVNIGKCVIGGGYSAVTQFCSVGDYAMMAAMTCVNKDVPPYLIVSGHRSSPNGINKIGLERNGFSKEEVKDIYKAYKIFFLNKLTKEDAIKNLQESFPKTSHIQKFIDFIQLSESGICR